MMAVATMEMAVAHHPTITGMAIVEPFVVVWVITILIQMVTAMLKMALMQHGIMMQMATQSIAAVVTVAKVEIMTATKDHPVVMYVVMNIVVRTITMVTATTKAVIL